MNKFKIWVVEDQLAVPVEMALERSLGSYAEYMVLPDPAEAIAKFEQGELPDIILIDVDFGSRSSEGPIEKVDSNARGFTVAAELKHHAAALGRTLVVGDSPGDLIYRVYTGNKDVREHFRWLYTNPFGHDPLIPISEKAGPVSAFDLIEWIREETHKLAKLRLRYSEKDLSELVEEFDEQKLALEYIWAPVWNNCQGDFETSVSPRVDALITAWNRALMENPDLAKRNALPEQRLLEARSGGAVIYAQNLGYGETLQVLSADLLHVAREFGRRHRSRLMDARERIQMKAEEVTGKPYFEEHVGPLFPFESQEIAHSNNPDTIVRAVVKILNILGGTIDHNYNIARAFKSLIIPGTRDTLPTTVFAHARHGWAQDWQFTFPIPSSEEEKETLLREELGLTESVSQRVPVLGLHSDTLSRILSDGQCMSGLSPLTSFAEGDIRDHWEECPVNYLRHVLVENPPPALSCKLKGVKVTGTDSPQPERVLTDWRHIFDPDIGLVFKILRLESRITGLTLAHVSYGVNAETMNIELTFALEPEFYYGPVDLSKPGGGLRKTLKKFLGWGRLTILTNSVNTCYRTSWPGGEPKDCPGDTSSGRFKLQWQVRNYLRTRCAQ